MAAPKPELGVRSLRLVAALAVALVTLFLSSAPGWAAGSSPSAPTTPKDPTASVPMQRGTVQIAVFVERVEALDMQNGSFTAVFTVGLACTWDCTFDQFSIVNGDVASVKPLVASGEHKLWAVKAQMFFTPDLHEFPFDAQKLPILIENDVSDAAHVSYQPVQDFSGLEAGLSVPGWDVAGWELTTRQHPYPNFDATFNQADFSILLDRNVVGSIFKIFFPLITIVFIGLVSLLLRDPRDQLRSGGTALIATMLFWIGMTTTVTAVSYMTFMDEVMGVIYTSLALIVASAIAAELYSQKYEVGENKGQMCRQRRQVHKWSLIGLPTFLVVCLVIVWVWG